MMPDKKYDILISTLFNGVTIEKFLERLKDVEMELPPDMVIDQKGWKFYVKQLFEQDAPTCFSLLNNVCQDLVKFYVLESHPDTHKAMFGNFVDDCLDAYKDAYDCTFYFGKDDGLNFEMPYYKIDEKNYFWLDDENKGFVYDMISPAISVMAAVAEHEQLFDPEMSPYAHKVHKLDMYIDAVDALKNLFKAACLNSESMVKQAFITHIKRG